MDTKHISEVLTEIERENSATAGYSVSEKDANITPLSENNTAVQKLLHEPVTHLTDVPLVDVEAVKILESKAVEVDRNLRRMMDNISRNLNSVSTTSVEYAECYRDSVKNVGNASDSATKAMGKLIGKCEEMNKNMEPLYSMAEQVKTINTLLDQLEEKCK